MSKKPINLNHKVVEVRKKLEGFILFYRFDTTVEEVEAKIFNSSKDNRQATHEYNQWRMDKFEESGHEFTQKMLDMITEAWNTFPQKSLGGKSPNEMYIEIYGKKPPSIS